MKEIPLTHGKVALVDDDMFDFLSQFKWHAVKQKKGGGWHAITTLVMHRIVAKAPEGVIVDHKDRDGLNNLRENLRHVTVAGNAANRAVKKSSKYIGVTRIKLKNGERFRAYYNDEGQYVCVGHFMDEDTAAFERDKAVFNKMGATAELNFPERFQTLINEQKGQGDETHTV